MSRETGGLSKAHMAAESPRMLYGAGRHLVWDAPVQMGLEVGGESPGLFALDAQIDGEEAAGFGIWRCILVFQMSVGTQMLFFAPTRAGASHWHSVVCRLSENGLGPAYSVLAEVASAV